MNYHNKQLTDKVTIMRRIYRYRKFVRLFILILIIIIIISAFALYFIEHENGDDKGFLYYLWVTIFTIVGASDFADYHPTTGLSKFIAIVLSLCGLCIIGWIIAEIAGNYVLKKIKEVLGMSDVKLKNHYIMCGWNSHANVIVDELNKIKLPLAIIANIEKDPLANYSVDSKFIKGECDENSLKEAYLKDADTVLILADRLGEKIANTLSDIDARTILTALDVKEVFKKLNEGELKKGKNKKITTIIELLDPKNIDHARHAHVDDIILYNKFCAKLFVTCAVNKGISAIFADLLSFDEGYEFYTVNIPKYLINKNFDDAIIYYRNNDALPIAIIEDNDGAREEMINPPNNKILTDSCRIVVISKEQPKEK